MPMKKNRTEVIDVNHLPHYSLTQAIVRKNGSIVAVSQNRNTLGQFTAAKVSHSRTGESLDNFMNSPVSDSTVMVIHNRNGRTQVVSSVSKRGSRVVAFLNTGEKIESEHKVIV